MRRFLETRYQEVRSHTEYLCSNLLTEDFGIQSMPDVSPPKWHLAHTTWFFETFILIPFFKNYKVYNEHYGFLFNSYYEAAGQRLERNKRGLISRPSVSEIFGYRKHVDQAIAGFFLEMRSDLNQEILQRIELGLHHEQQHQELLLTDILHNFATNPLRPNYQARVTEAFFPSIEDQWIGIDGGLVDIGADDGFSFDNEKPMHRYFLKPYQIQNRLVTNQEYLEFINDGGYENAAHWLSDGWHACKRLELNSPLYWEKKDGLWWQMTLQGMQPLRENEPVCHISFYEADAFAKWRGVRLPTEYEWEWAAKNQKLQQLFGLRWQWTSSAYQAYPGFKANSGALGEYNGKFMCNQLVLRGSSVATPHGHERVTYRNFFPPEARWQFTGLRLAKDQ